MLYAIDVKKDEDDSYFGTCRDLPEFLVMGESIDQLLKNAVETLDVVFSIYIADRRPLPKPSEKQENEYLVNTSLRASLKGSLSDQLFYKRISRAELARRLSWSQVQVDRLLSMSFSSKLESFDTAFKVLDLHLDIVVF